MSRHTSDIAWTDHVLNPWMGCTRVSEGCDNCRVDLLAGATAHHGGLRHGRYLKALPRAFQRALGHDRAAGRLGARQRVLVGSICDPFDPHVPAWWRDDLWAVMRQTRHLDWMLLTKHPAHMEECLATAFPRPEDRSCLWLGVSVESQRRLIERVAVLARLCAPVRFLVCEPLLEELCPDEVWGQRRAPGRPCGHCPLDRGHLPFTWVIAGGEVGLNPRPSQIDWYRSLRAWCRDHGIPFHLERLGRNVEGLPRYEVVQRMHNPNMGERPWEWPADLWAQEGPDDSLHEGTPWTLLCQEDGLFGLLPEIP